MSSKVKSGAGMSVSLCRGLWLEAGAGEGAGVLVAAGAGLGACLCSWGARLGAVDGCLA